MLKMNQFFYVLNFKAPIKEKMKLAADLKYPSMLQYKEVTTLTQDECLADFEPLKSIDIESWNCFTRNINNFKLCTKNFVGSGSCYGDSGGPLVGENKTLIGIISASKGCSDGYPDIYTNVYRHIKWIYDEMNTLDDYIKGLKDSGLDDMIGSYSLIGSRF